MNRVVRPLPWLCVVAGVLLAGCAVQPPQPMAQAAITPLNDLNLVHAPIPAALQEAGRAPYRVPEDRSCASLQAQVRVLDEVLGADVDAPPTDPSPGLVERGSDLAGQEAVNALRRTAESVVPFRSWVRRLSGAERYSRQVSAAIAAGTARRAFLKGLAVAAECSLTVGR